MRVLLDENLDHALRKLLGPHEVVTVTYMGWTGLQNGELLTPAKNAGFELFILADKNLRYQQNLAGRRLAILELWTNHRPSMEKHFPFIQTAAESMVAGEYRSLESP